MHLGIGDKSSKNEALILNSIFMPVSGSCVYIQHLKGISKVTLGNNFACSGTQDMHIN